MHGNIGYWGQARQQVCDQVDVGNWLVDRGEFTDRWCEVVQGVASQGRVPNVAVSVNSVFDRACEKAWVGEGLGLASVHVDTTDGIGSNGREPEISTFSLGTHDCRSCEREREWVFLESAVGGVEASDFVL